MLSRDLQPPFDRPSEVGHIRGSAGEHAKDVVGQHERPDEGEAHHQHDAQSNHSPEIDSHYHGSTDHWGLTVERGVDQVIWRPHLDDRRQKDCSQDGSELHPSDGADLGLADHVAVLGAALCRLAHQIGPFNIVRLT